MQADKADAIFAVGTIGSNGFVDGGTAYATTRGIIRGVPVYIFDQKDNTWKVWNKEQNKFVITSQPKLTPKAATIGTRELQDNGKNAIVKILKNMKDINDENIVQQDNPNKEEDEEGEQKYSKEQAKPNSVQDIKEKITKAISDESLQTTEEEGKKVEEKCGVDSSQGAGAAALRALRNKHK